jgi:hypothetical protein
VLNRSGASGFIPACERDKISPVPNADRVPDGRKGPSIPGPNPVLETVTALRCWSSPFSRVSGAMGKALEVMPIARPEPASMPTGKPRLVKHNLGETLDVLN